VNRRGGIVGVIGICAQLAHAEPKPPADAWLTEAIALPRHVTTNAPDAATFAALHTKLLAEQLRVRWPVTAGIDARTVTLHFSADAPGHWPSRDWRALPMTRRGENWEANLPVDDLEVPLVYFVSAQGAPLRCSPLRVVAPRAAGLEQASRVFWPFLDGFEEGLAGWETTGNATLKLTPLAHDGHAALVIAAPDGQRAVRVSTPRVRGWHYTLQLATGVRVWLRATRGGVVRFHLHAHADSPHATSATSSIEVNARDQWQRVDLAFTSFGPFNFASMDRFTIEFAGEGELLVDDLRLLGRWRLPGD
jgi:hypothetical protein